MTANEVAEEFDGVTGEHINQVLHHLSDIHRGDLIARVPAVTGTQRTKIIAQLETKYPGKHFAILEGEPIGLCDTWEESRALFTSAADCRLYMSDEHP